MNNPLNTSSATTNPVAGDTVADAILAIKAELRSAMNGITSRTIRDSGMGYKLIFGVELPRLREIAKEFQADDLPLRQQNVRRLAMTLWQEDIRECKLLAILLYPIAEFDLDMADLWLSDIMPQQAELAQLLSMELLCRLPQAADTAFIMMADERPVYQLCGFLTLTRLLMQGVQLSPDSEAEFLDQAAATLPTEDLPLRKAVTNALLRFGERSEEDWKKAEGILNTL